MIKAIDVKNLHVSYGDNKVLEDITLSIDRDFPIIVKYTVLLATYHKLGIFHRPGKKKSRRSMTSCSLYNISY